jgi:four helix bundle protein
MATYKKFEDLPLWNDARAFRQGLTSVLMAIENEKGFEILNQLKRAALSIMTNIAEGYERGSTKEFVQYLIIAKGSLGEVRSLRYSALDDGIISNEINEIHPKEALTLSSKLMGFINYLKSSEYKYRQKPAVKSEDQLL